MRKILLILLVAFGLQTQAQQSSQYFCCDSITYWTDQSQGFNIGLDTTNIIHNPDSIQVWWSVCTSNMCYAGQGMYYYFGQIMTSDTIKVCYDAILYTINTVETCTHCDSLIFNGTSWVLFSMGNPTAINELEFIWKNHGKVYDLLGRELIEIPIGKMYIKNNKKCIRIK
jgi:hypothetical protein|tara:strand:- start:102 stop:611 length:510 start_codon:yes stop_codon:yes gene_type:complete